MPIHAFSATFVAAAAALLWSVSAQAATDPTGIWFDHNGRGAVEIKQCANGNGLCGHVVNIKDPANASRCGLQILGEVTPSGGGWIYSPERKQKYDVALTRLSDDKLRVVGNAGSRFFSRTFTWNRAPDDIARCGETTATAAPALETQQGAKPTTTSAAPAPITTGAASGAAALVANTSARTTGAVSPTTKEATAASTIAPSAVAPPKPAAATAKTAAATSTTAGATEASSESGSKRKCKYKIPYIGRTVSVPCRD